MKISSGFIKNLLSSIQWNELQKIRLFWVKINDAPRNEIASELVRLQGDDVILPLILRDVLFVNANAILSDFIKLIEINRSQFESVSLSQNGRLTIVLLLKDDLKLSQISSPVNIPKWFPVLAGSETFLKISHLIQTAEVDLLHCPESKVDTLAEVLYEIEEMMVQRLRDVASLAKNNARSFIDSIFPDNNTSTDSVIDSFEQFLHSVSDPKAYRPNSSKKDSLISLLLHKIIKSSPDQLSALAKKISETLSDVSDDALKPTLFAIMLRPGSKVNNVTKNWHAMLLSYFQVYQLMNAAAHAGEYPTYPVNLIYSNAHDLIRFLNDASLYMAKMNEYNSVNHPV